MNCGCISKPARDEEGGRRGRGGGICGDVTHLFLTSTSRLPSLHPADGIVRQCLLKGHTTKA